MVAQEFIEQAFPKSKILTWCSLARSSFYYQPGTGIRGRKPYASVTNQYHQVLENDDVIEIIKKLFENPFVDYGYYKTYIYLKRKCYLNISKYVVYRLMKSHKLLRNQYIQSSKKTKRNWVKDLLPQVNIPFTYLEFDIKFVWVAGKNRNVQVLTVLDVFSRWNVSHLIAYSIKYQDVMGLFERIFEHLTIPEKFYIRCDNGSQFIADLLQKYFKDKKVTQEFTKPATPQQNSHIESYHSIMESAVCQRFQFKDLKDVKQIMNDFRGFYNFERIHGGIGFQSPADFLKTKGFDMKNNSINQISIT
jgi:putative transposase